MPHHKGRRRVSSKGREPENAEKQSKEGKGKQGSEERALEWNESSNAGKPPPKTQMITVTNCAHCAWEIAAVERPATDTVAMEASKKVKPREQTQKAGKGNQTTGRNWKGQHTGMEEEQPRLEGQYRKPSIISHTLI